MDRKRPDFPQYLRWLGLTAEASRLDILSRSGGEQKGDMCTSPRHRPSRTTAPPRRFSWLVGPAMRCTSMAPKPPRNLFRAGDGLVLVDDDGTNEANPQALLLKTPDGAAVGWMPDLLIEYARQVRAGGGAVELLQNNGRLAPWHARLLVRISGRITPGTAVFTGGVWPPLNAIESLTLGGVHSDAAGETNGFVTSVGDDREVCALVNGPGLATWLEAGA